LDSGSNRHSNHNALASSTARARQLARRRHQHPLHFDDTTTAPHYEEFDGEIPLPSRLIPRAILVDTEPGTLQNIQASHIGRLFSPDNILYGSSGAGNNWAKGHYSEGKELLDIILDRIRRESEMCDHIQACQLIHSLGGGTGSGLGSLLIEAIQEEFPHILLSTYSVIPSPKVSDTVVEPYNTTLAMNVLIERVHQVFTFDNEALYHLAMTSSSPSIRGSAASAFAPSYSDLNGLIARAMSGTTSTIRYPGTLNCDYRKLAVNLIPFPRLHFYMVSQAPLLHSQVSHSPSHSPGHSSGYGPLPIHHHHASRPASLSHSQSHSHPPQHHHSSSHRVENSSPYRGVYDIMDISHQLFDAKNFMSAVDPRYGKYLTCACLFRTTAANGSSGQTDDSGFSLMTIQEALTALTDRHASAFTEWIPNHIMVSLSHTPYPVPSQSRCSSTLIANNTAIQEIWKRILDQYSVMFHRKAFLHWYTAEGMEEMEFIEAEENLKDLITEYQQYQDMIASNSNNDEEGLSEEERVRREKGYGEDSWETMFF
jgi:tubulin beta